jgi:hypothetical protein
MIHNLNASAGPFLRPHPPRLISEQKWSIYVGDGEKINPGKYFTGSIDLETILKQVDDELVAMVSKPYKPSLHGKEVCGSTTHPSHDSPWDVIEKHLILRSLN